MVPAAAVAPNDPQVAVRIQERGLLIPKLKRQTTSTPNTNAVISLFPSTLPTDSAAAKAAGRTLTNVWRAEASRVSSKSRACIMVLLARAARGGAVLFP